MTEEQGAATEGMAVASADAGATTVAETAGAADQAHSSLTTMLDALINEYDHPHHAARLEQIASHVKMLHSLVDELPQAETNRKDHADRLLEGYRRRQLPNMLPHGDEELLEQELARMGEER